MSTDISSPNQPMRPSYPRRTRGEKAAMALAAVLVSSTLLGAILSLFEIRSEASAIASASTRTQPAPDAFTASATVLAQGPK